MAVFGKIVFGLELSYLLEPINPKITYYGIRIVQMPLTVDRIKREYDHKTWKMETKVTNFNSILFLKKYFNFADFWL